jgi:hypothetical protein
VTSCRIDWLLEGLADVLGGPVGLLPRQPRLDVAAALLQEGALGLERALLDGGPCKWRVWGKCSYQLLAFTGSCSVAAQGSTGRPIQRPF